MNHKRSREESNSPENTAKFPRNLSTAFSKLIGRRSYAEVCKQTPKQLSKSLPLQSKTSTKPNRSLPSRIKLLSPFTHLPSIRSLVNKMSSKPTATKMEHEEARSKRVRTKRGKNKDAKDKYKEYKEERAAKERRNEERKAKERKEKERKDRKDKEKKDPMLSLIHI